MGFVILIGVVAGVIGMLWWSANSRREGAPVAERGAQRAARTAAVVYGSDATDAANGFPPVQTAGAEPLPPTLTLLTEATLTADAAQRLADLAGTVPRPRTVLLQLLQAGDDPLELARIVATDPSTVALLLRTVNSAQFGLSRDVTSVQHAITYLGANLVRDVAIRHALAAPPGNVDSAVEQVRQELWVTSYLASAIAFALAQQVRLAGAADLSTQALLFGLGDLALVARYPQLAAVYRSGPVLGDRVAAVQNELGLNAALAGAHLARAWELPRRLGAVLAASLAPVVCAPDTIDAGLLPAVTIGYFANRLGETLATQSRFELRAALDGLAAEPAMALLPTYLAAARLDSPGPVLLDPAVERRLAAVHASVRPAAG
jgi:HD-like signal output (HDOD) protein